MYIIFSRGEKMGKGAIFLLNKATPLAHNVKALSGDGDHANRDYGCW